MTEDNTLLSSTLSSPSRSEAVTPITELAVPRLSKPPSPSSSRDTSGPSAISSPLGQSPSSAPFLMSSKSSPFGRSPSSHDNEADSSNVNVFSGAGGIVGVSAANSNMPGIGVAGNSAVLEDPRAPQPPQRRMIPRRSPGAPSLRVRGTETDKDVRI